MTSLKTGVTHLFLLLHNLFDVESFTSINYEASTMLSSKTEVVRQPGRRHNVVSAAAPRVVIIAVSHIIQRRIECQPGKTS